MLFLYLFAEPPAFEVLPSLKRLKQRIIAAARGQYDAVFMSGRYKHSNAYLNIHYSHVLLVTSM